MLPKQTAWFPEIAPGWAQFEVLNDHTIHDDVSTAFIALTRQ